MQRLVCVGAHGLRTLSHPATVASITAGFERKSALKNAESSVIAAVPLQVCFLNLNNKRRLALSEVLSEAWLAWS